MNHNIALIVFKERIGWGPKKILKILIFSPEMVKGTSDQ